MSSNSESSADSFESIALPHLPAVARIALALTHDASDADDLVQETYLRALKGWHTFVPGSDCRRWLATICRNTFMALRNRELVVTAVEDDTLEALGAADPHRAARALGLDDLFDRFDLGAIIQEEIERLAPPFRSVVMLSEVEGFTYAEIAELLGIPIGTVRSRLFRARRLLQEALIVHAIDRGFATTAAPHKDSL